MKEGRRLMEATVGLTDPAVRANIDHIRTSLRGQIPAHLFDEQLVFQLRGRLQTTWQEASHHDVVVAFKSVQDAEREVRHRESCHA